MTIDEIVAKYDGLIRKTIYGRCDADVFDDRYQDTILAILEHLDTINTHPNPVGYIITVAKRCARPTQKKNQKMLTYGGWTNDDDEDSTEEWLLEDDTHNPEKVLERKHELKQRKRAEDWAVVCKKDVVSTTKNVFSIWKTKNIYNLLQRQAFYGHRRQPQHYESYNLLKKLAKRVGIRDLSVAHLFGINADCPINIKSVLFSASNNIRNLNRRNEYYLKYLQQRSENEKSK